MFFKKKLQNQIALALDPFRSPDGASKAAPLHIWSRKKFLPPKFAIELNIKKCFDNIDHQFIINNIGIQNVNQQPIQVIHFHILREWLKSGFIDIFGLFFSKEKIVPTTAGILQSGPISPYIANIMLNGIEHAVKNISTKTTKLDVIHVKLKNKIV